MTVLNIPNTLTLIRIVIVPLFVIALLYGYYRAALALFVVATFTDFLDGMIARKTGQKTPLGAFLDPLADKVILLTSFIIFAYLKWIPKWLVIIVISRDLILILGWVLLYIVYGTAKVEVLYLGKITIASQFILIVYTLTSINFGPYVPQLPFEAFVVVGLITTISGIQYIYRGLRPQHVQQ